MPETQFFEGDSAFSSLGLTRTQRLYGFAARYVVVVVVVVAPSSLCPSISGFGLVCCSVGWVGSDRVI
jgi:hypothetical protein